MIYKVVSNVYNLYTFIPLLKGKYNIFFNSNNLFLAPLNYNEGKESLKIFNNKKKQKFFVTTVDENTLVYEPPIVKNWCKEQFVRLDLQKFEIEEEEKIQEAIKYLDDLTAMLEREEDETSE